MNAQQVLITITECAKDAIQNVSHALLKIPYTAHHAISILKTFLISKDLLAQILARLAHMLIMILQSVKVANLLVAHAQDLLIVA